MAVMVQLEVFWVVMWCSVVVEPQFKIFKFPWFCYM